MTKVIFDSFNTHEEAVAFVNWFMHQSRKDQVHIVTTGGTIAVSYDGVDLSQTSVEQITLNICGYNLSNDEGL